MNTNIECFCEAILDNTEIYVSDNWWPDVSSSMHVLPQLHKIWTNE